MRLTELLLGNIFEFGDEVGEFLVFVTSCNEESGWCGLEYGVPTEIYTVEERLLYE